MSRLRVLSLGVPENPKTLSAPTNNYSFAPVPVFQMISDRIEIVLAIYGRRIVNLVELLCLTMSRALEPPRTKIRFLRGQSTKEVPLYRQFFRKNMLRGRRIGRSVTLERLLSVIDVVSYVFQYTYTLFFS